MLKLKIGSKVKYQEFRPFGSLKTVKHTGIIIGYYQDLYKIKLNDGRIALGSDIDTKDVDEELYYAITQLEQLNQLEKMVGLEKVKVKE